MQPPQRLTMHARLLRDGWLGTVIGIGTNGHLTINGRWVSWTESARAAATPRWQVDASEITIPREPIATSPDLVLIVRGERTRFMVDLVPVSILTKGLIINARRASAARTLASAIFQAQALGPGP